MDSCKFTPFGLCVKTELLKRGKSQKWLEEEVSNRYGMYADSGYMYKILTGQRNAPKIVRAIREILELPSEQCSTE
ncbi:XRE family transcriptional regulator [Colidextribacter sp. OB.20]|uniref:XRE family transcriptional regulator n=1 Tax=Colidextribacter sp. OB.20 TaxID=2304568 RepID=UPI00136B69D8|nr:XRE family transcriptional regulator [Colidextribacter sp. OB.20]